MRSFPMMPEHASAFAPGRVNLIGEHTDYNGGLALPFAVESGVTVTARRLDEASVCATALDLGGERDRFALGTRESAPGWRAFVRGAVAELIAAGFALPGAELQITGTVPRGSGLSSSAALEVALCLALIALAGSEPPAPVALAQLCSRVENDWVGARTGLLDQLASLCGRRGHAVLIDFTTLRLNRLALRLAGHRLVTLDSGERHSNAAASGYNERRRECAEACRRLGVESLSLADRAAAEQLPEPLRRRARHVLSENGRVRQAVASIQSGEMPRLGELLDASHASLRDDYEISTPAVEAAVARLRAAGAIGARILGGGFGGHILGLMAPGAPLPPGAIEVEPGAGARLL
jgi:galactokinase